MAKFKYNVKGYEDPWDVDEKMEEEFLVWAKDNKKEIEKIDQPGNQQSSAVDATAEQNIQASTTEVNQPQKNQKKKNTDLSLDSGFLESTKHSWLEYQTQDNQGNINISKKPFFDKKEDEAIAQLKTQYPGFKFEKTNFFERLDVKSGKNVIKITSPDGKNSTKIPIGLTGLLYDAKDFEYDNAYNELTSFVDKYSNEESNIQAAKSRQKNIDLYKDFNNNVKYTDDQRKEIQGEFYNINEDGSKGEFKLNAFDVQIQTKNRLSPVGKHDVMQSYEHKHQPYEEELKQAVNNLRGDDYLDPKFEDAKVREEAANIIIEKKLNKIIQNNTEAKLDEFENKDEEFKQYKLEVGRKELENKMNAEVLTKLNIERELYDGEDSITSELTVLMDRIENEEYQFDLEKYGDDKIIELENGRLVPEGAIKEYENLFNKYLTKTEQVKNIQLNLTENSHHIKQDKQMMDLLKRNYNGVEEFFVETGLGFYEMALGASYGGSRFFGQKNDFSDTAYIDFKNKIYNIREGYKKDVEFDDAFKSVKNMSSFYMQELSNQLPVILSLSIPGGQAYIGGQSFGNRYSDYERVNRNPLSPNVSQEKMWWGSLGYAVTELAFETLTTLPLVRAFKTSIFNMPGKNQLFKDGAYQYFKNAAPRALGTSVSEGVSEGLTGFSQNMIDGKWDNLTDNLDHMMFSGLMFGTTLSSAPFLKGLYVSQFSDYNTTAKVRNRVNQMKKLETLNDKIRKGINIYGKSKLGTQKDIDANNSIIKELQKANESDYKKTEKKVSTLTNPAAKLFMQGRSRQQELRLEAERVRNSSLPNDIKQDRLSDMKAEFDAIENSINDFKSKDTFNNNWSLFKGQKKNKSEIQRVLDLAKQKLIKENKNITDENIDDEARLIYNKETIYSDIKKRKGRTTKLRNKLVHHETIDETIDYLKKDTENKIKKLEGTDTQKKNQTEKLNEKLNENIKEIKNGAHGFMSVDANGDKVSVINVDNMAKDDRLETKTHELNHVVFTDALGFNPKSFKGLSDQILTWTKENNNDAYQRILLNTERRKDNSLLEDEVVAVFFEEVAAGNINLNKSNNSNFAGLLGHLIGKGTKNSTDAEIDLAGETDAIKFLTTIAKKIKNDDLTISDIKKIKKSKVLSEQKILEDKGFDETKFSKDNTNEINDMAEAYETEGGNKIWYDGGYKSALDMMTEQGLLDDLIFSATQVPIPNVLQEKFKNDVYAELTSHVRNYKPERNLEYKKENLGDATGLFGWINPQLRNKVLNVQKRPEYSPDELSRARDITEKTEEGAPKYQTADTALNPEEQMIAKEQGLLEVKEKGDFIKDKLNFSKETNKAINDIVKEVNYDVSKLYEDVKQDIISQENPNESSKNKVEPTGELYPVIEAVSTEYGVDPRAVLAHSQNLTAPETKSARTKIAKDAERLGPKEFIKSILPQFNFNPKSGKSIGLRTGMLKSFYIGSEVRVPNIKGQALNVDNMTNAEILAPFGINPDFTLMPQNRSGNFDAPVKGIIVQSSAFAANQSARVIKGKPKASISIGKPRTMFSKSVNDVLNIRDLFELETKGIDKLLSSYGISNTFNLRTEQGRKQFVEAIETELLPLMPKDFWFGKDSTVFTASNKAYGLSMSKPNEAKAYNDLRNKIKALKNKKGVKFGKDIKGVKDYSVSSYNTLFRSPSVIEANIKNGKIKAFNKKVSIIHKEMWKRFNNAISKDNNKASIIGTYLKLVANDTNHWHKLGAQFVGYSKKITGARVEYEHAMPATAAYLYLIDAALSESNFDASYKLVTDNYKLIALDKAMDKKLTSVKLQRRMPTGWSVIDNNWWGRYFNSDVGSVSGGINPNSIIGLDGKTFGETFNVNADGKPAIIKKSQSEIKNINNAIDAFNKQAELIKKQNKEIQADLEKRGYKFSKSGMARGMSTFDFDETLIIDGENFVVATDPKTGEKINIKSGDWPIKGPELAAQGYEFNFDDFVNVRGGIDGPLLQKMKNQIKKYGTENVFILTARPQEAATAIDGWLKSKGINIPFKNITGLANSTGEAKANWMLEKFAEGYNDMYFVDDALPNVKAVKNVLEQLDIKSKVVQAKIKFSKSAPLDFNKILEQTKGIDAGKRFSVAEARKRGIKNNRFNFFVPPSAEDFKGLLYSFLGRGKEGDAHMKFFKDNLLDPYAKGYREWNTYKQAMADDYAALKKQFAGVSKILKNNVKGTSFTNDTAVRVYLWNKAGFEIPGISKTLQDKLVKQVNGNPELKQFAEGLSVISRRPEGYVEPSSYWTAQTIGSDLNNIVGTVGRKEFLSEWIDNKDIIFDKDNLNKIEAIYGSDFRDALENMLYRMETGTNRTVGKDANVNMFLNWINGSVGATMFINMRSAVLQTISTVNFINWGDNNVFTAAKAFANQPQYWKDFMFIMNSPMLKQRRAGLQIDVSASELTSAFSDGKSKIEAVIAYILEKGFTPTKIADSLAISLGGATFYRNRLNTYVKQGMSEAKAKKQAFLDFQEIAEETQQSSRPDLISMQQAGVLGRVILAWQNTPMQMTRLTKKAMSDLVNRRGSDKANISRIIYYGVAQNVIFGALQTGLMFMLFGNDEDEEKKKKMELRVANGAFDTLLRGTGVYGAAIATLKNILLTWKEESKKGWKRENMNIAQAAIDLSPPMGSKLRKLMQAVRTEEYNKGVSKQLGFRIENPNLSIAANLTEALTNIPVARTINKMNNVEEALTGNHDIWQRVALVSGWSRWSVGVKDEELEEAKADAKEARRIKKQELKDQKKEEEKKAKEEEKKKIEEEKKKQGIKNVRCSAIKSDGKRCNMMVETKNKTAKCVYHRDLTDKEKKEGTDRDNDGIKEFRCTATKSNGQRCKNRTENKNKKCYAHQ